MLAFSIFCLSGLFIVGTVLFIDCRIVGDLPENNEFKRWWKKYIASPYPED
jgi:hypothetical protein